MSRSRSFRSRLGTVAAVLMLGLGVAACDGEDSGPGELSLEISSQLPLSAAVVEIAGDGITGARALSNEQVAGAPVGDPASPGYRVVVFRNTAGPVRFVLEVDDVSRSFTAIVLDAADADGGPVAGVGGLEVSISR